MPKKAAKPPVTPPDRCFVKELVGETPPSFAAMEKLYAFALEFFSMNPWEILDESQLFVTRNTDTGELRYCLVMGAIGEVFSLHVYLGDDGLRQFRRVANDELTDPLEYFGAARCLYVESVLMHQLEKQDRELLRALGHPRDRGGEGPIFRSIRPGYFPWFVNAEEARTLTECLEAAVIVCRAISANKIANLWDMADQYPCLIRKGGKEPFYTVERVEPGPDVIPAAPPVQVSDEFLRPLRNRDMTIRGSMELDYIFTSGTSGKEDERKACMCIALAVDAKTGFVYSPEPNSANISLPAEALARVFLKAVAETRVWPEEVAVRNEEFKTSLTSLMDSFGVKLTVSRHLPALDEAKVALLSYLETET